MPSYAFSRCNDVRKAPELPYCPDIFSAAKEAKKIKPRGGGIHLNLSYQTLEETMEELLPEGEMRFYTAYRTLLIDPWFES